MKKKTRVLVIGIGGVGGFFGGHLAKKYEGSEEVEIIFAARGENQHQIEQNGLKVIEGSEIFITKPALVTNHLTQIGIVDFILICTKSYDLKNLIEQIKPCAGPHTIVLPLLNGVDGFEILHQALPDSIVLPGCVYIVATLNEPGVVENKGNIKSLYFGAPNQQPGPDLMRLHELFIDAGIDAYLAPDILSVIWEKFIFISTTASATTYFNSTVGTVVKDHENTLIQLISEVVNIALAKGIKMRETIHEDTLTKLKSIPAEATSSMHRDFKAHKKQTELDTLTGYVVDAGKQLNLPTPTFNMIYQKLKEQHL